MSKQAPKAKGKYNGALIDERTLEERRQDYSVEEVLTAASVRTFAHTRRSELAATVFNQWYTSSCVPHGFLTQLEYEGIITPENAIAQLRAYRKRSNYPHPGSGAIDMYAKIKAGQSPLAEAPVIPGMSEAQANALPLVEGDLLIDDFKYYQYIDANGVPVYDKVPSDVALGKAVSIFIYATVEEWSQEFVEIKTPDLNILNSYVRHCVCIVPEGDFTENGKKWLTVHDSSAFGGRHMRHISLDFLMKRCYYAAKVIRASEQLPAPVVPEVQPTKPCGYGERNDAVKAVQKHLADNGFLEERHVTGYYGNLTASAVLWWQLYNHLDFDATIPQLLKWGGRYWGSQSIKAYQLLATK